METNETFETGHLTPSLVLTAQAQVFLTTAGKWAVFLGIMGFIGSGFILLAAIFAGTFITAMSRLSPTSSAIPFAGMGGAISAVYVLFALLSFFFALYMYQFGSGIKKAIQFNDSAAVARATEKLKSFFKLWGITTIVVICFYILAFIILIVVGIGAASMFQK